MRLNSTSLPAAPENVIDQTQRCPNRGQRYTIVKPIPTFARDNNLPLNPTIGGHVAITVTDLAAVKRRLDAADVVYADVGEYAMAGMRSLYLYDPAMNVVEINQVVR